MGIFSDILGTTKGIFRLGLAGPNLKNVASALAVRNAADNADAAITASAVNISGEILTLNSDAAESGADWKATISRAASGMTANLALVLPVDDGTPSQVLQTDGSGNLSWVSAGDTGLADKVDTTAISHGSGSPVSMFSTGAADVINHIDVIVDEVFDGTAPTLSLGISGSTSKYSATTDVDLKTVGVYQIHPGLAAGGIEALIATLVPDSSTTGEARINVFYATPA